MTELPVDHQVDGNGQLPRELAHRPPQSLTQGRDFFGKHPCRDITQPELAQSDVLTMSCQPLLLWISVLSVWVFLVSCGVGPGGASSAENPIVVAVSGASLSEVSAVDRFLLREDLHIAPADLLLVKGTVSDASESRLRKREIPEVLSEERQPLSVWSTEQGLLAVPGLVLSGEETYSLVALSVGVLAVFEVRSGTKEVLTAANQLVRRGGWAVYCLGAGGYTRSPREARAFPEDLSLRQEPASPLGGRSRVERGLAGGLAKGSCLRLEVPQTAEDVYVPPTSLVGQVDLDPAPLRVIDEPASGETSGNDRSGNEPTGNEPGADERPGPSSVQIEGSSVFLEVADGVTWVEWQEAASGEILSVTSFRGEATRLPLGTAPPGEYRLGVATVTTLGDTEAVWIDIEVVEASAHLVLTEVMANPRGPEPANEWIEVVNVGRRAARLFGYSLGDSAGSVLLPDVDLPAGSYGLLVREDYRARPELDPVPNASAIAITVPELAAGGLLNAGEQLTLYDPLGRVVSRIPAMGTSAGVSLARREPYQPDVLGSFGPHADPGSSPGSPNDVTE